ncbi:uncharacterized protein Eint_050470 [Encephalitozoon intestinalis ATCC 50506]|uniref:Uncharacterized protein n=1 Tax=Encephalitozoon intestinalis (strain ATCC 50506) TaxID=876142 RepID=E0S768_ENCIT|nr:uncharacterized protein Eint_050470 [Encephalitozoon intestinalis ATCC 50506]ADM11496.1 hypothetical protein Eint_050470 [Encephalitozoon intestinalis ATCC 50506]UTX45209.1 acidic ribosomal protein P0-like protein [Encephalitozoon intestinalis]
MGAVTKKSKEKKHAELEKVGKYAEEYPLVAVIENPSISNVILKKIREDFSGVSRILFVRKKMARAVYNMPSMPKDSFFLMFGDTEAIERAKTYQYEDFLEKGDVCPARVVIEKQVIRNKEMIEILPVSMKDEQMQLKEDYVACEAGEEVDEVKAKILRFFGKRLKKKNLVVFDVTPSSSLLKKTTND